MPGAAFCTRLLRFSAAYRSTLKNGTMTDNMITFSTIRSRLRLWMITR